MHQTLQPVSNVSEIQNKTLLRSSLKGYLDHICLRISLSNSRSMIGFGATNNNSEVQFKYILYHTKSTKAHLENT